MNFLYPGFLFALAAISIPIIIHLFNFRRYKTVYFSNVNFLKNLKQETKAKSQLKHWLILLARILAITCLVLAFARPYIPVSGQAEKRKQDIVSIYVDNSFSMDAEGKSGSLLEVAKNNARSIAESYPPSTRFYYVNNDFDLQHQHLVSREQLYDFLSETNASPHVRRLSEVFSRQKDFLLSADTAEMEKYSRTAYFISDFQRSSTDFNQLKNDSNISGVLLPIETQSSNNLYIDSVWFATPTRKINQSEQVFVKIINNSEESYQNIPVKLSLNDSLRAMASFNIEKNATQTVELSYTNNQPGILHGRVGITDYPVTYDNDFYFSYAIAEKVKLLIINHQEENKYLNALFNEDEYFSVTNFLENNIITSEFKNYHVIILNGLHGLSTGLIQALVNFTANGGTVLFIPDFNGNKESYNQFLGNINSNFISHVDSQRTMIQNVNYQHEIYTNVFQKIENQVDLPVLLKHFVLSNQTQTSEQAILSTQNQHKILSVVPYEKGRVYTLAVPLDADYSNFVKHPLFVPTIYNIALYSQTSATIYYTIGEDEIVELSTAKYQPPAATTINDENNILHITALDGSFEFIPQQTATIGESILRLNMQGNINQAGNYIVRTNEKAIAALAYNYNRNESALSYYDAEEIKDFITKNKLNNFSMVSGDKKFLTKELEEISQGKQYWKHFLVFALLFLAIEILLVRLWK